LYLRVRPTGIHWIYRYSDQGKRFKVPIGKYPEMGLAAARQKARACASDRFNGKDPLLMRQRERAVQAVAIASDFATVAKVWHTQASKDRRWSATYTERMWRILEINILPWLGKVEIQDIQPVELVRCLHRVKDRGTLETAQRLREVVQQVFSFAVDLGLLSAAQNFVTARTGALPPPRAKHHAAILDPTRLGELLRNIDGYNGHFTVRCALQLAPLLFQRPGQLRFMHWEELNFEQALWTCPAAKMKIREWKKHDPSTPPHIVPLPEQALRILGELYQLTGPSGPVFKSVAKRSEGTRYLSENTLNAALRNLGYDTQSEVTAHGFRATARTLIREELKFPVETIERHLAHTSKEKLGEAYDRARLIAERRVMAQAWADYLDRLKRTPDVSTRPKAPLGAPLISDVNRGEADHLTAKRMTPPQPLQRQEWRD
jgi:integrase